jgi:hypothetical protein
MMVADELEVTALREDCSFIIDRAILETEDQAGRNPIAAHHLEEVTHRNHAALFRAHREKAVNGPLDVPYGYRLGGRTRLQGTYH